MRRPEGSGSGQRKLHSTSDHDALEKRLVHDPCTSQLLLPILILLLLGSVIWGFWASGHRLPWGGEDEQVAEKSQASCRLVLAESIPEGMDFGPAGPHHLLTHQVWLHLIDRARSQVSITAYNVSLRSRVTGSDHPSDWQVINHPIE
ncbi:5'-3' exonuclease PLD4-like [Macrotis lagotis]|uniref:5'-3' exonuclease PLD4-like n=1 Tax=Macrotis lagotis TaxID=92651 RepID=UPI003D68A9DA